MLFPYFSRPNLVFARVLACGTLLLALLGVESVLPAGAASRPGPVLQRKAANVTADALPTTQIDGVATTQVVVGNLVFVGGRFAKARPAGAPLGTDEVERSNLLAYDIATGELVPGFAPQLNAAVKSLAVSPDHKTLYVGGQFTKVGEMERRYFAAFDLQTYELTSLAPSPNRYVNAIATTGQTVFLGGSFSAVNGQTRPRLAAVRVDNGALKAWNPRANSTVQAMTLTTDNKKLIVGGAMTKLGTTWAVGMGAVSTRTGTALTWKINKIIRNSGPHSGITSLKTAGDLIYGGSYTYGSGNFEGAFAAKSTDGAVHWLQDCHGDTYDIAPIGNVLYSVGHAHYCKNIGGFPDTNPRSLHYPALAVTTKVTGKVAKNGQPYYWGGKRKYGNFEGQPAPSLYNWFPAMTLGPSAQAAWSITGNATYLAIAGEFPTVNKAAQQGLVRFAVPSASTSSQGPQDRGTAIIPRATLKAGDITVSWLTNWDKDDMVLTYVLKRDGEAIATKKATSTRWSRPTLKFTDTKVSPGSTLRYTVTVIDPDGNSLTTSHVKVTLAAS